MLKTLLIITQKRMSLFTSHWQQCQSFDILIIITAISAESCIEILTSLGKSPTSTDELFLTKLWLSKDSGNNNSVFISVMEDRMGEGGWMFLNCLAFSRQNSWLLGYWGPQSRAAFSRTSQGTDIFRPLVFVSSFPWFIISISKCFEAKANRTSKKISVCHVITVLYIFTGTSFFFFFLIIITGTSVIRDRHH